MEQKIRMGAMVQLTPEGIEFYKNVHKEDYSGLVFTAIEPHVFNLIDDITCWRVRQLGHTQNFPMVFYPEQLEVIG